MNEVSHKKRFTADDVAVLMRAHKDATEVRRMTGRFVETVASPSQALRRDVEATLLPTGVTWEELAVLPVCDLLPTSRLVPQDHGLRREASSRRTDFRLLIGAQKVGH